MMETKCSRISVTNSCFSLGPHPRPQGQEMLQITPGHLGLIKHILYQGRRGWQTRPKRKL